jgi:hydroxypyruvate reductase
MPGNARNDLLDIFDAAVAAVNGATRVREALSRHTLSGPVFLIAIGKAACAMARGAHEVLGDRIADALIVTRRGAGEELPWPVIEAGHPLPDESSLAAGERLEAFIGRLPQDAVVLVLLSGGGSALVERLPPGIGLDELRALNGWLLGSGLDIHAMNAIRKRISTLKGGRLARRLHPRRVLCLAISDVRGDDPRSIASGPLTAEPAGFDDSALPGFVRNMLTAAPPMPTVGDPCFQSVRYEIVACNDDAKRAAARAAEALGYRSVIEPGFIEGDAIAAGARLAREVVASASGIVRIWGGETTVVLPPAPGRGGRCQALALAAARELAGRDGVWLLAAGTDGSDGPTEDAGALVDGGTISRGEIESFDASLALAHADAGTFLEASGDLVSTGPTGTNVMDILLGLNTG